MLVEKTPVEYYPEFGLFVKREDLSCPEGPRFSKARGVYAHVRAQPASSIAVLDTSHSRGGWAVAQACALLGKKCSVYFPLRKAQPRGYIGKYQEEASALGARICPLPAGRSAILYSTVRKRVSAGTYVMPNALKLPESIRETAAEFARTKLPKVSTILVSASSGTIASGVLLGIRNTGWRGKLIIHMGYARSKGALLGYITAQLGGCSAVVSAVETVDEGYAYADVAKLGPTPSFPCDQYYDLKAFRWWIAEGREKYGEALLWNIG